MRGTERWRSRAGPKSRPCPRSELAKRFEGAGVAAIIFTDISRDGMMEGANVEIDRSLGERRFHSGYRKRWCEQCSGY